MATTRHQPAVEFDHHTSDFAAEVDERWRQLRENTPIAWSESYDGFWIVSDWRGNYEVLKNHGVFTTDRRVAGDVEQSSLLIPRSPAPCRSLPEELDPPEHGPLRRLLNPIMSPAAARAMQPRIEHWVRTHIDAVIESGECDLIYDLASPVPAFVTLEWLGYPLEHATLASEAYHELLGYPPGHERFVQAIDKTNRVAEIVEATVAARRAQPRDDIISYFIEQEVDGARLDDRTIVEMCITLIAGGVDSTTSLTSSALVHLHRDHELRQRFIADPALLVSATEEFLRYYAPFGTIARTIREDTELRGCPMKAGERVLVSRHSANYDASEFAEPERFDPERFPNRHTSFGLGIHRCSGSHLARLTFREMITQVLARMPDYVLDDAVIAPYPDRGFANGWVTLPSRFTPGPRSTTAIDDRVGAVAG